jgi:hypothetical protein
MPVMLPPFLNSLGLYLYFPLFSCEEYFPTPVTHQIISRLPINPLQRPPAHLFARGSSELEFQLLLSLHTRKAHSKGHSPDTYTQKP